MAVVSELFREYQAELNVDLCFQGFEEELANLPDKYIEPTGCILLAEHESQIIGCVAVRRTQNFICEMKRLYVRPEGRGISAGRLLAEGIIHEAKTLGFKKMQLDTLQRLSAAMALYDKLGFKRIPSYYDNPLSEVIYWELEL